VLLHYLANSNLLILLFCKLAHSDNFHEVRHGTCRCRSVEAGPNPPHILDPGIKINGAYYRDVLLKQEMLPDIRAISGDFFIFQQDNAPANRARETVALLQREVPVFIAPNLWPPNSPDLNPVDYKVWGTMQDRVYWAKVRDVDDLNQRLVLWLTCGTVWSKASSTTRSTSGVHDFVPVSVRKGDISNSLCNLHLNFVTN